MPTDKWLIFAYVMIFSSVIFCNILPMIYRLWQARQRFHRYDLERLAIEYSCPRAFLTSQSIYSDIQLDVADVQHNAVNQNFQAIDSPQPSMTFIDISFIDEDETVV